MRVAVYARVSTEDQGRKGYSLPSQVHACSEYARKAGAREIVEFVDTVSGSTLERPGLSALRREVRSGTVDLVVVYDPDRLARNLSHQLILTEEIEKHGVRLEFVNFEWKNTPEGKLFYSLRGAVAEYEREKIKERVLRGKRQKALQGGIVSVPRAYGYVWDKVSKTLKINEKEAEVVRRIFRLYIEDGLGTPQIAERLALGGILPPRGGRFWHRNQVNRILRNELYCGVHYQNRWLGDHGRQKARQEWIPVNVPAIVPREMWEKAQEVCAKNTTNRARHVVHEYLLSGLLYCHCGSKMSAGVTASNRVYRYYSCERKRPWNYDVVTGQPNPRCASRYVRCDRADALVWNTLKDMLSNPDLFLQELLKRRRSSDRRTAVLSRIEELGRIIEGIKPRKQQIARFAASGLLTEVEASELLAEEQSRQRALEAELREAEEELKMLDREAVRVEDVRKAATTLAEEFKNAEISFDRKQQLVRLLVRRVVASENGDLVIEGYFPIEPPSFFTLPAPALRGSRPLEE